MNFYIYLFYLIMIVELNVYLCGNGNVFWVGLVFGFEFCVISGVFLSFVLLIFFGVKGDWRFFFVDFFKKEREEKKE